MLDSSVCRLSAWKARCNIDAGLSSRRYALQPPWAVASARRFKTHSNRTIVWTDKNMLLILHTLEGMGSAFLAGRCTLRRREFPAGDKINKILGKKWKTYTHSCTRARSSRFFAQSIDVCQNRGVTREFNHELRILKYRDFCSHRNLAVAKSPRVLWPN